MYGGGDMQVCDTDLNDTVRRKYGMMGANQNLTKNGHRALVADHE